MKAFEEVVQAFLRQLIKGECSLPAAPDNPAVSHDPEVLGNNRLWQIHLSLNLSHIPLSLGENFKDSQSLGVTKRFENLCDLTNMFWIKF